MFAAHGVRGGEVAIFPSDQVPSCRVTRYALLSGTLFHSPSFIPPSLRTHDFPDMTAAEVFQRFERDPEAFTRSVVPLAAVFATFPVAMLERVKR